MGSKSDKLTSPPTSSGPVTAAGEWGCGPRPRRTWSDSCDQDWAHPQRTMVAAELWQPQHHWHNAPGHTYINQICVLHYLD